MCYHIFKITKKLNEGLYFMQKFKMSENAIDVKKVPQRTLYTGKKIPAMGIGTFGSDRFSGEEIADAIYGAIRVGYRFIDCASVYKNEHLIGDVLSEAIEGGLERNELFVMSKVWNDKHDKDNVIQSCKKSIADLKCDYLDCYIIHWPFPNYHEPGCDVDARQPNSRPYFHEEFMETWRAMEELVDMKLVKHIGVSNMTIPKLQLLLNDCRIKPAVHEMEIHPTFQQGELFQFCLDHEIQPIAYAPIGSPMRPERDILPEDLSDIDQPIIKEIAKNHNVHPAIICLKWAVMRGQIPIPFSLKEKNYLSNLKATIEDPLTPYEFNEIRRVERDCRLVKGQVFLWPGATDWRDLWDIDGTIPGWDGYENLK